MKVKNLLENLELEVYSLADEDREIEGAYVGDLLSWVMSRCKSGNVFVTIMSNVNVLAVASLVDVSCVIIAENAEVGKDLADAARQRGINLFASALSAYELCSRLHDLSV